MVFSLCGIHNFSFAQSREFIELSNAGEETEGTVPGDEEKPEFGTDRYKDCEGDDDSHTGNDTENDQFADENKPGGSDPYGGIINAAAGTISGTVIDASTDEPVAGVYIYVYTEDPTFSTETDDQGQYSLAVPAGTGYELYASGRYVGYSYHWVYPVSVMENEIVEIDITLYPLNSTFTGTVTDAASGDPISDVRISVYNNDYYYTTYTGGQGDYSLAVPAGNGYTVRANAQDTGYFDAKFFPVDIAAEEIQVLDFQLAEIKYGAIQGQVTDAVTGQPVTDVEIQVYVGDFYFSTQSDEQGEYSLAVAVGSDYTVRANGQEAGYSDAWVYNINVVENETEVVNFQLTALEYGTIQGVVTDAVVGEPVAGVELNVYGNDYWFFAYTDDQGEYSLAVPAGGGYTVRAYGRDVGYSNAQYDNTAVVKNEIVQIDFVLIPLNSTISGTITAVATGEPINDVWVSVFNDDHWYSTHTDGQGWYTVALPAGSGYTVSVNGQEAGYANASVYNLNVAENETELVNFQLTALKYGTIQGVAIDTVSGEPVAGVELNVYGNDYWFYAYTDDQGEYSLVVPTGSGYTVRAYGQDVGYSNARHDNVVVAEDDTVQIDFVLIPLNSTISGMITDFATGEPISGVRVVVYNSAHNFSTYSDGQGQYAVAVPAGSGYTASAYGLEVDYADAWVYNITVAEYETEVVNFQLTAIKYGAIQGAVTEAVTGEPIAGAEINIFDNSRWFFTYTDEQGCYVQAVPVGSGYTVRVNGQDAGYSSAWVNHVTVFEDQAEEVDFRLTGLEFATVTGTVQDEVGDPIADMWVYVSNHHYTISALTDSQGVYSMAVPAGRGYMVSATGEGAGYTHDWINNVRLVGGETRQFDFQLDEIKSGSVAGHVINSSGEPVTDLWIYVYNNNHWSSGQTDTHGRYLVEVPADKGYTVWLDAQAEGYATVSVFNVSVAEGEQREFDFELVRLEYGTITGRVTCAADGEPVAGIWVYANNYFFGRGAYTDTQGYYSLEVQAGTGFRITADGQGYSTEEIIRISVAAGETVEYDFELTEVELIYGTITGTITDTVDKPLAGILVNLEVGHIGGWNSTVTDSRGFYLMKVPAGSDYMVSVSGQDTGYSNDWVELAGIEPGETENRDFVLTELQYGTVMGSVTGSGTGGPVKNVRIEVNNNDYYLSIFTNGRGQYSIDLPVGSGVYSVRADGLYAGYSSAIVEDVEIAVDGIEEVIFQLDELVFGNISGTVTDYTGQPLAGITVFAWGMSENTIAYHGSTGTNQEGDYFLEMPAGVIYTVNAYGLHQGYVNSSIANVVVTEGDTTIADFTLENLETVAEARVVAAEAAVDAPFPTEGTLEQLKVAYEAYWQAWFLVDSVHSTQKYEELSGRLELVKETINALTNYWIGEAEGALEEAEEITADPFPTLGTVDEVLSALKLVSEYADFIYSFAGELVQRLDELFQHIFSRYILLLEQAQQQVSTVYNPETSKHEAELTFEEGSVSLHISSSEGVQDTVLTLIKSSISSQPQPARHTPAEIYLDIRVQDGDLGGAEVRIEISYDPQNLPTGMDESKLRLYRFNEISFAWDLLPNQGVDLLRKVIWADVTGFSNFGLFEYGIVYGDVNGDEEVNVSDAILVLRHIAALTTLDQAQLEAADVNSDGCVDVADAILILRYIVEFESQLPVPQQ